MQRRAGPGGQPLTGDAQYSSPTSVPMMPEYLRGVINLRGLDVPVIDLAVRFGKPASAVTKRTATARPSTCCSAPRRRWPAAMRLA